MIVLKLLSCAVILCTFNSVYAQVRGTGLLIDDTYRDVPIIRYGLSFSQTRKNNPIVSLKKYFPNPRNQGLANSCTGWAVGYNALTAAYCIKYSITDSTKKCETAFSAMFLYNLMTLGKHNDSCHEKTAIPLALDLLCKVGDCKLDSFCQHCCGSVPDSLSRTEAKNFRIKGYSEVFVPEDQYEKKVNATVESLCSNRPVVVALKVTQSFQNDFPNVWSPVDTEKITSSHAVVVIGYDDLHETFELINSYGIEWRDNGFFILSYADFYKFAIFGFVIQDFIRPHS